MLHVITGGQSGVDEGAVMGVHAWRTSVIEDNKTRMANPWPLNTDWECVMPKGYRRETPMPLWLKELKKTHITCLNDRDYGFRTAYVTNMVDAVLVIAEPGKSTPGTELTIRIARDDMHKQLWRFQNVANRAVYRAESHAIAYWLRSMESFVCVGKRKGHALKLMVAGPRESKWADGLDVAYDIVKLVCEAYERDIHVKPSR